MIDVFKIGVHLGFATNGTAVIGTLVSRLTGLHASINQVNANLGKMRTLAVGALGVFAGYQGLKVFGGIVNVARELNSELEKTKLLGGEFTARVVSGQYERDAVKLSRDVPTSTADASVAILRDLHKQLSSYDDAKAVASEATKLAYVMGRFTGEDQHQAILNAFKVAEARGAIYSKGTDGKKHIDPSKLAQEFNAIGAAVELGSGFLKTSDFLQMVRQAGPAAKTMDAESFYAVGGELAVLMGGSKTGTAMTSLFSQLVGGVMPLRIAEEMQKVGLLNPGEYRHERGGHIVLGREASERLSTGLSAPDKFMNDVLVPLFEKRHMSEKDMLLEMFRLFGRQTTQRLMADLLQNAPNFERARRLFPDVQPIKDAYKELLDHDFDTNLNAFTATWKSFKEELGLRVIPTLIPMLGGLTDALKYLCGEVERHPTVARDLMLLAGGLSALVMVGGGLAILRIALFGFGGALTALTGIGGLAALGPSLLTVAAGLAAIGLSLVALKDLYEIGKEALGLYNAWRNSPQATPDARRRMFEHGIDPDTGEHFDPRHPGIHRDWGNYPPPSPPPPGLHARGRDVAYQAPTGSHLDPIHVLMLNAGDVGRSTTMLLARAASRPAAGPTGYEPRKTPMMPGRAVWV